MSPGPPAPNTPHPQVTLTASEMQTFFFSSFASVLEETPAACLPTAQPGLCSGHGWLRASPARAQWGTKWWPATPLSAGKKDSIWPVDTEPLSLRALLGCLLPPKSWPSDSLPGPLTPGSRPPQPSCFHSRDMAPSPRSQSVRPLCSLPNQCPSSFSKGPFCPHGNPPCFPSSPTCPLALAPSACQPSLPCPPGSFQLLPSPFCVPQRQEGQRGDQAQRNFGHASWTGDIADGLPRRLEEVALWVAMWVGGLGQGVSLCRKYASRGGQSLSWAWGGLPWSQAGPCLAGAVRRGLRFLA